MKIKKVTTKGDKEKYTGPGKQKKLSHAWHAAIGAALLAPVSVHAVCVDGTTGTRATGETCNATLGNYTGALSVSVLTANGANSILNVSGGTTVQALSPTSSWTPAHGIHTLAGGTVNVNGDITVSTQGYGSTGLYSAGASSSIVVDGNAVVRTTGGINTWNDGAHGFFANDGGSIIVKGNVDITTGTNSAVANSTYSDWGMLAGTGSTITVGDAKIRPNGSNSIGIGASGNGATVTAGKVDILVTGGANIQYAYGIVAQNGGTVTFAGGTVAEKSTAGLLSGNISNTALRAVSDSTINVTGDLSIQTEGSGARGVYASGGGTINLSNTDIHMIKGTYGAISPAIQLGRSRGGTLPGVQGEGFVNSYGALTITQEQAGSPAIYVEGYGQLGSVLNAGYATSSTNLDAAGTAIMFGASETSTDPNSFATITLNNASITTSSANAALVRVGGAVGTGSALNLANSSITAASGGWLINVEDRVLSDTFYSNTGGSLGITPNRLAASDFTFSASNTALTGSVNTVSGSQLHMALNNDSIWTLAPRGSSYRSTLTDLVIASNSRVDASSSDFTLAGNVTTNGGGTLDLSGASPSTGQTLRIEGNYVGNGGKLKLDTQLGDDASPSDKLVIDGGHASGSTSIYINNIGGIGAMTTGDGILVVGVENGGTTDSGAFSLGQRVAAGAYEYTLVRGGMAAPDQWYLSSAADDQQPNYRDEVPVYSAAPAMAGRLGLAMLGTYHDRAGEDYALPGGGAERATRKNGAWGRVFGESGTYGNDNNGSNDDRYHKFKDRGASYDYDLEGLQAGLDLYREYNGTSTGDAAGIYFGVGHLKGDVDQVYGGGNAGKVEMNAYSLGGYWTRKGAEHWYLDGVLQVTRFDDVKARSNQDQSITTGGWGFAASIEGGYPFVFSEGWAIEPQAQLIYQGISLDDKSDQFGNVSYGDTNGGYGRIGARLTKNRLPDEGLPLTFWVRANLWSAFGPDAKTTFTTPSGDNAVDINSSLGGTWWQMGLGVASQVSKNISLFASGDYNQTISGGSGHGWSGQVGVRAYW